MYLAPCKDCKDRDVNEKHNCHSDCQKYLEWSESLRKANEYNTKKNYFEMSNLYFK